jgi:hypothetical protein
VTGGGTVVTLRGTGFGPEATVTFGGIPASDVHVIDGTSLTAVTPAHAVGKVDVVVVTSGGWIALLRGYSYETVTPVGDDPCFGCWDY